MDNNDYTILDSLLGNLPSPRTLNEDTSAGVEPPPAIAPSVSVNNPPDNPIPGMQSKTDKPVEGMPKFKCPKCMSEAAATETKGKYKCSKCGQTFTVDEAVVKESSDAAEKSIINDMIKSFDSVHRDVKKMHEILVDGEYSKLTVADIENAINQLNDLRKQLGGQTWVDLIKKKVS
jgi:ribosomal protein L37AE/L43A